MTIARSTPESVMMRACNRAAGGTYVIACKLICYARSGMVSRKRFDAAEFGSGTRGQVATGGATRRVNPVESTRKAGSMLRASLDRRSMLRTLATGALVGLDALFTAER